MGPNCGHLGTCIWPHQPKISQKWLMGRFEPFLKNPIFWRFLRSRTTPNNGDIRFSAPKSCSAQFFSHKNLTTSTTSRQDDGFPGPSKVPFLAFKVGVQENFHWCFLNDLARKIFFCKFFFSSIWRCNRGQNSKLEPFGSKNVSKRRFG